ncbi:MAG: PAS domain S-box protein [Gemmobacter sp.]|nr:PAS domain S-box protein [Gemmobacter sp.]
MERHVPWWIAEQYAVEIVDSGGTVQAARARRAPEPGAPRHAISFDPPLRGMALRIAAYVQPARFGNTPLLVAIIGLSAFAILALLTVFRNAARRRRAELRLQGEMAFRRSMEDSLTVGLRAKDTEGRVLYVNSAFCNLVGFDRTDLVGRQQPMPYWAPDQLPQTLARQKALSEGGARAQSFETRFRHSDGREIDVQVYDAPLIDARGAHIGWMGSVIDVTETKRAARLSKEQDDNLARTGRLVTLGEMASTLAHELNQPLGAIASYAAGSLNLLREGQADPAKLTPALEKLAQQASRAGQIIRRIQDFVKKRAPQFTEVSLAHVIAETVGFLSVGARDARIAIVTDITPVPPILADAILLEQVLINLIRNGMEAMGQSPQPGDKLTVSLRPTPDGGAVIEVADMGSGIDPAVAGQLFDAFSSTKPDGMGMGLNICRSIIEMHRGQLTHHAAEGRGTVFVVTLPSAQRLSPQEAA